MGMPSVYGHVTRMARTNHKCCECGRIIRPGQTYEYHHGVWDGRGADYRRCIRCEDLVQMIFSEMSGHWNSDEGISFGELGECAREHGFCSEWEEIKALSDDVRSPRGR
jgi:hypothetical protein